MFESIERRLVAARCVLLVACVGAAIGCHPSGDVGPTDGGADAGANAAPMLITEPDQGMTPIYALLSSAKHTLDMTMYELNDPMATSLLVAAAKNGVTVRVILDQNLEMSANTTAYNALSALGANVTVHWANPVFAATHQKTITVDGTTSAIMTLNFSAEDYTTSRDFAFITSDPADVAAIETTFAADLMNASITPPNGTNLVWSPTNSQTALVDLINGAQTSLLVENEEMGYATIVSALANAASRGVDVKIVIEASSDYAANFTILEAAGATVVTYRHSSLYIHAKVVLADYGTSAASVFLGSENFSHPSLTENRELGIITSDAATMDSLHGTLTSDFAGGKPFVPSANDAGIPVDAATPTDAG
ncbi:MAG TPA: phospholipase D-like domain-containing protein [Polyangia bacterium]